MDRPSTSKAYKYTDPNFQDKMREWFEEDFLSEEDHYSEQDDADFIQESSSSSSEEDVLNHDAELEEDSEPTVKLYKGKNGYSWRSEAPNNAVRTPRRNIVIKLPTLRAPSRALGNNPDTRLIWAQLIDDDIINEIIFWTNRKLQEVRASHKNDTSTDYKDTDYIEMSAFFGLLLLSSIFRSAHENLLSLFSTDVTGRPIFRATMSARRFEKLLICLRFDNPDTRQERKETDGADAAIFTIFKKFVDNCQKLYNPGPMLCIDEMLVSFRGKCSFKMYMPNKPSKYGLKVMCLTDAKTSYFYNGYIYTGKNSDGRTLSEAENNLQKPTQAIIRLSKPLEKSNRNITADNYFSSLELVQELNKRGFTYVGTLRKNKREIPQDFLSNTKRPVGSTLYGFSDEKVTLISHVPKKNKSVVLLSTMHYSKEMDPDSGLPEIIAFYNTTKGGVDCLDMKCANFTSGRRTRRWPLAIFYRILDISMANAFVLYNCYPDTVPAKRFDFIKDLGMKLIMPHIQRRSENPRLEKNLKTLIRSVIGKQNDSGLSLTDNMTDRMEKRATCRICPYHLKRKTFYQCLLCQKPICLECSKKVCKDCINENLMRD